MLPNVGIIGTAGSGKSTLAEMLVDLAGYVREPLAWPVKVDIGRMLIHADDMTEEAVVQWVDDHKAQCRGLLQAYGVAKRELVAEDYWITDCLARAEANNELCYPCVVDDVRFPNEVAALREAGWFIVKVDRPDDHRHEHGAPVLTAEQKAHPSEAQIDDLPADYAIRNSDTPEMLFARFLMAFACYIAGPTSEGYTKRASIAAGVFPCR